MAIIANKLRLANCQGEICGYLFSTLASSFAFAFFLEENLSISFTMLEKPKPWENITSCDAKNRKPYFIIFKFSGVKSRVVKLIVVINARILQSTVINIQQMMKVIMALTTVKGCDIRDSRYSCAFLCLYICSLLVLFAVSRPAIAFSSSAITSSFCAIFSSSLNSRIKNKKMERVKRFELSASTLARLRSSQLSYTRKKKMF